MPCPFPGMDPYLEAPDIWPDFHFAFAVEISSELNRVLPHSYYARLGMRPEMNCTDAPLQHRFVEIRDPSRRHALITVIEIATPATKRPGPDRESYWAKRQEIHDSDASVVELDLLRGGQSLIAAPAMSEPATSLELRPGYLVKVNRAWQRGARSMYELFPVKLEESLPHVPVPLRERESEPLLDLQYVFQQVYDSGPYARGAVDYDGLPDPPIPEDCVQWLNDCLDRWRLPPHREAKERRDS